MELGSAPCESQARAGKSAAPCKAVRTTATLGVAKIRHLSALSVTSFVFVVAAVVGLAPSFVWIETDLQSCPNLGMGLPKSWLPTGMNLFFTLGNSSLTTIGLAQSTLCQIPRKSCTALLRGRFGSRNHMCASILFCPGRGTLHPSGGWLEFDHGKRPHPGG